MRRLAALLIAPTLLLSAPPATAQSFASSSSQLNSQVNAAVNGALKDAYRGLPQQVKDLPQVKQGAKDLGLIDPPAKKSTAPQAASQTAPRTNGNCSNCVALTFDDGPAASTTGLLDILKRNQVHASFFVLAPNANANPQILRRMRAEGHTIGNHTSAHKELNKVSAETVNSEIRLGTDAIKNATGLSPRWMRPPYGATNGTVAKAASAAGQAQALWAVDTLDWKTKNSTQTCQTAVGEADPGEIILMHDIHPTTVAGVQCIIDGLRAKGLKPVSLDEMIPNPVPGRIYYARN